LFKMLVVLKVISYQCVVSVSGDGSVRHGYNLLVLLKKRGIKNVLLFSIPKSGFLVVFIVSLVLISPFSSRKGQITL